MSVATTTLSAQAVHDHLVRSVHAAPHFDEPYSHWLMSDVLPYDVVTTLLELPFVAPALEVSGTREVNNHSRQYFDPANLRTFGVMQQLADVFQSRETVKTLEQWSGASLAGSYLRMEYAMDTDGFWLEPHTDIGPKRITILLYISRELGHHGTDIYYDKTHHCRAVPFVSNSALVFVPSPATWHGVEKRRIVGVRRSVIINYVGPEWRSVEQLSFPGEPVA